ncbi:NRDE family protein [Halopenitus malekzadehii]|uniref:NRDE family protein n=1 Tax=Halopenitus malekzadehii TaxID=1267564 RepID=UPI000B850A44|nr:NRDE family protein [Halopenitus malekzadehii]
MCTLALAWHVFPGTPIAVGANRDEQLDRPAEPPQLRPDRSPAVIAPRDREAGGTWMGLTETGLYVLLTNRWLATPIDGDRSRGLLVDDCLDRATAREAVSHVRAEIEDHGRSYAGFSLVLADSTAAFLLVNDGRLRVRRLDPGVHVLRNVGGVINGRPRFAIPDRRSDAGTRQRTSARAMAERARPEPGESAAVWLDRLGETLGDHDVDVCIHGETFGTRSSTLVRTGDDPAFRYADGPPCTAAYDPIAVPPGFAAATANAGGESHL